MFFSDSGNNILQNFVNDENEWVNNTELGLYYLN